MRKKLDYYFISLILGVIGVFTVAITLGRSHAGILAVMLFFCFVDLIVPLRIWRQVYGKTFKYTLGAIAVTSVLSIINCIYAILKGFPLEAPINDFGYWLLQIATLLIFWLVAVTVCVGGVFRGLARMFKI